MAKAIVEGNNVNGAEQSAIVSPWKTPYPKDASVDALRRANNIDRANLAALLRRMNINNVYEFMHDNFDTFLAEHPRQAALLGNAMDYFREHLNDSEDKYARSRARRELRKLAVQCVNKTSTPIGDLNHNNAKHTQLLFFTSRVKFRNPFDEQYEMDVDAALKQRTKEELVKGVNDHGLFVQDLLTGLGSFRHLLRGWARTPRIVFDAMRMRRGKRALAGLAIGTAIFGAPALPGSANVAANVLQGESPFAVDTTIRGLNQEACDVQALFPYGVDVARFEQGLKNSRSASDQHYIAAMTGVKLGVSPAALYALSMFETNGFRDTFSDNSSATGPYQMVTSHKLHVLAAYGKKTDTYQNARARIQDGTASAEDRALVGAFDRTIAAYNANPHAVIARIDSGVQNADERLALSAADQPVLATELMAPYILHVAPEMGIQALEGATKEQFALALSFYYAPQLMGEDGGAFFRHMVKTAPATRIDDSAAIARRYRTYNPGAGADRAAYIGRYYASVAGRNPSIFKSGTHTSFQDAARQIANHMTHVATRTQARMIPAVVLVRSTVDACNAGNEAEVARNAGLIAAENLRIQKAREQTLYSAAWEQTNQAYTSTLPAGIRQDIAWAGGKISALAQNAYAVLGGAQTPASQPAAPTSTPASPRSAPQ